MPNGDGVTELDGISIVPQPSANELNQRQIIDYRGYREKLLQWMYHLGKSPSEAKGYALSTVNRRACDCDQFMRYVWDEEGRYTTDVGPTHADGYLQTLAMRDTSRSDKANKLKSLKMLLRYHECKNWEPAINFQGRQRQAPPDYLSRDERALVREASLEFGTVPAPSGLSAQERAEWDNHLAMRYNKPATEVTEDDYQKANGMKYPAIVWTAMDAGLRPVEVGRARTSWVDTNNCLLRVPRDNDSKGQRGERDNWTVALRDQTIRFLTQWLDERALYEKYDDTDRLWLTRHGNPYTWRGLKHILQRLCEIVNINTENRKMTWYAIRHSTGTYMSENSSLEAARVQLRRKTVPREYDNTPPDERRRTLEEIE